MLMPSTTTTSTARSLLESSYSYRTRLTQLIARDMYKNPRIILIARNRTLCHRRTYSVYHTKVQNIVNTLAYMCGLYRFTVYYHYSTIIVPQRRRAKRKTKQPSTANAYASDARRKRYATRYARTRVHIQTHPRSILTTLIADTRSYVNYMDKRRILAKKK